MTIAQQIGALNERHEQMERARDFYSLAGLLLRSDGKLHEASKLAAKAPRVSRRVQEILSSPAAPAIFSRAIDPRSAAAPNFTERAAVSALTLDGTAFADYKVAAAGFAGVLSSFGVFDRLLANGMLRLPMGVFTVGAITVGAVGYTISEGSAKPISSLTITSATADIRKAMAAIAISEELARVSEDFDNLLGQALRAACIKAVDEQFIAVATSGAATITSSGSNLAAFLDDLGTALHEIGTDVNSRLFIVMTSKNAEALAILLAETGSPVTAMTPRGGTIAGVEVLVSDALAADTWLLVDATAFAAATGEIALTTLRHGSINMSTTPDSPPTSATHLHSLWQLNQRALVAERFFILEKLRTDAAAVVGSANYASGFSP
jgi:hypothetical protein